MIELAISMLNCRFKRHGETLLLSLMKAINECIHLRNQNFLFLILVNESLFGISCYDLKKSLFLIVSNLAQMLIQLFLSQILLGLGFLMLGLLVFTVKDVIACYENWRLIKIRVDAGIEKFITSIARREDKRLIIWDLRRIMVELGLNEEIIWIIIV